jgi:adenine-specific DNA glycosylase
VKKKLGVTYCIKFKDYVLLQRSEGRILENLYCFPVTRFVEVNNQFEEQRLLKAIADNWQKINSITHNHVFSKFVKHTFSHFHLKLFIIEINLKRKKRFVNFEWVLKKDIVNKPSSALMKKIQEEVFC